MQKTTKVEQVDLKTTTVEQETKEELVKLETSSAEPKQTTQ